MSEYAVILVHTTSHAIRAHRVLKKAGRSARLVPTPRHLSSDCGSAVRIAADESEECEAILSDAGVEIDRIECLNR